MTTILNPSLSDLFFNYEKSEKTKYPTPDSGTTMEEYEAALMEDAKDFIDSYEGILSCDIPTAEELQADYLHRL